MLYRHENQIEFASKDDFDEIIEVWDLSVRATHHFLEENYRQRIKILLPSILSVVTLFVIRADQGRISGFLGVLDEKIEMLFIHPDYRGKGIGKALTEFAINGLFKRKVDVNEQNEQALGFYKHMGFMQTGRTETDSLGKPYPIIEMELLKHQNGNS